VNYNFERSEAKVANRLSDRLQEIFIGSNVHILCVK
jgi:hypothetical protein